MDEGCDVNFTTSIFPPLTIAANRRARVISSMLFFHSCVHSITHYCLIRGFSDVVRLLIRNNADVNHFVSSCDTNLIMQVLPPHCLWFSHVNNVDAHLPSPLPPPPSPLRPLPLGRDPPPRAAPLAVNVYQFRNLASAVLHIAAAVCKMSAVHRFTAAPSARAPACAIAASTTTQVFITGRVPAVVLTMISQA
jgi:hypothetical protein